MISCFSCKYLMKNEDLTSFCPTLPLLQEQTLRPLDCFSLLHWLIFSYPVVLEPAFVSEYFIVCMKIEMHGLHTVEILIQ